MLLLPRLRAQFMEVRRLPPGNSGKLRVMVLDEEVPWPPNSGKRIRTWNLLCRLAGCCELHFFTYGPLSDEGQTALTDHGVRITAVSAIPPSRGPLFWGRLLRNVISKYPYSVSKHFTSRLQREVIMACRDGKFDLAHIEWIPYARYATPGLPRLITAHNVESDIWKRRALHSHNYAAGWFFGRQAQRMESFERSAAAHANVVVAVSELDAQRFRSYGVKNITVVPNGVDLDYFRPRPQVPRTDSLVFVGSLDWFPNEDAVKEFATRVLPILRRNIERITLRVVGRKPSASLATTLRRMPGVELVGEVPDVRTYMAEAQVVVVPLRIGGGTRIKVLEALAMGKPVISTSVGAEGLQLEDGRDLLLADTTETFVAQIQLLIANPELQLRLGKNGRATVEKLYGWDAAAEKLAEAWAATASRKQSAAPPDFARAEARR
jgi:sugar transferase (PEP-CTERM/EpsH1 system associated)